MITFLIVLAVLYFIFRPKQKNTIDKGRAEAEAMNKRPQTEVLESLKTKQAIFTADSTVAGRITDIIIAEGDVVEAGDVMFKVELDNGQEDTITCPVRAIAITILVAKGRYINLDDKLVEMTNIVE